MYNSLPVNKYHTFIPLNQYPHNKLYNKNETHFTYKLIIVSSDKNSNFKHITCLRIQI